MASSTPRGGRPTQFHGVPLEERAFDTSGNRLPWALEWAECVKKQPYSIPCISNGLNSDHPNARHQRRQPEEKGAFGKSTRRKGSSRATRTQTPAKKENPTLDGFEAALKFDAQRQPKQSAVASQQVAEITHQALPSITKEPMQLILYGYAPETQWAAISFYENVSGGMICEDYERTPPAEKRRFYSNLASTTTVPRRALTKAERALAMKYHGGTCWIKVTFDSHEAAERAIFNSPHIVASHWVYAEPYRGSGPEADEPIIVTDQDRADTGLGPPKPHRGPAATLGSSFQYSASIRQPLAPKSNSTLPRSFATENDMTSETASSTTASSTTAQNPSPSSTSTITANGKATSSGALQSTSQPDSLRQRTFTHFPNTPRTVLRPASEALLPQASWSERLTKVLQDSGWMPGDIIGTTVPRTEEGVFDWEKASMYWKVCYWIDGWLGTDLCGLKDS